MASQTEVESTLKALTELGDRLHYEVTFSSQFIESSNRPDIEKEWMSSFAQACNYSLLLIISFIDSVNKYKNLPSEQFSYYAGKIAIQHLIETINVFEQIINKFIKDNPRIRKIIEDKISKKLEIINTNWDSACSGKSKDLKKSIISQHKNKIHEIAFIRNTLFSCGVIDKLDLDIWLFAWDIRNSMHRNFTSLKNVDFKHPDIRTGVIYHFQYVKGQELHHPGDFIAFYTITEQLSFILLKILQRFSKK